MVREIVASGHELPSTASTNILIYFYYAEATHDTIISKRRPTHKYKIGKIMK